MNQQEKIKALAEKWLNGTITEDEKQEFEHWYNDQPEDTLYWLSADTEEELKAKIYSQVLDEPQSKRWVGKLAVAASVLVIIGSAALFLYTRTSDPGKGSQQQVAITNPIPEKIAGATLTLANGSTIALDQLNAGLVTNQGCTTIRKQADGHLYYEHVDPEDGEIIFNTITVPKGSSIQSIRLSDGTIAWLNMESTMRFPVSFSKTPREVEITGEVYFEVSTDVSRKFIVRAGTTSTEVLGTHFNINNYAQPIVTLLEGKVRLSCNGNDQLLAPGQQAMVLTKTGKIYLDKTPDLEAAMAWKAGMFKLSNANISTIMDQLSRWYDIDVQLGPGLDDVRFSGMMERKRDLAGVLEILSLTKEVRFEIKGKTVAVFANSGIAN